MTISTVLKNVFVYNSFSAKCYTVYFTGFGEFLQFIDIVKHTYTLFWKPFVYNSFDPNCYTEFSNCFKNFLYSLTFEIILCITVST